LWQCGEAGSHELSLSARRTAAPNEMEVCMADDAVVAQKGPYQVELTEGKPYLYCRCGRSQNQPFCDGSHAGTGIEPMRFVVEHTGTFNICGCKSTDDEPFCDGSHLML
jgi:CDGSH-type Zn-finger protein